MPGGGLVHRRTWLDGLIAAAAGYLHAKSFAPNEAWGLQLLAVAVLAWRVNAAPDAKGAAWLGWWFAFTWVGGGVWWLFVSMHQYGGMPAWMAALSVAALSALLALYLAAAMAIHARWRTRQPIFDALLFGACWLPAELARGLLFTGFPWIASGYAHTDGPLAALAPWIGVYGIGFVGAWLAAAASMAFGPQRMRAALAGPPQERRSPSRGDAAGVWGLSSVLAVLPPLALVLAAHLAPAQFTEPRGRLSVAMLQGNVPQDQKFSAEHLPRVLHWYATELMATRADLVIAPETAIPLLPRQLPDGYWAALADHFRKGSSAALIGLPLGDFDIGYTNSAAGLKPGLAGFYRYDKHHLVPFGEFIPLGFRWFVDLMHIPLGDFERGASIEPFVLNGNAIRPTICYEDLFGEELAPNFVGTSQATIIANLSNVGWFGDTEAIPQHLQISRMRSLEFQRPLVRATNTGATAIVDHAGRVTARLAPFTQGTLTGEIEGRWGSTPYARWVAAFGLWPLLLLSALVLGAAGWWARRRQ
jgi:apolipoprotein N-acyltransferase